MSADKTGVFREVLVATKTKEGIDCVVLILPPGFCLSKEEVAATLADSMGAILVPESEGQET